MLQPVKIPFAPKDVQLGSPKSPAAPLQDDQIEYKENSIKRLNHKKTISFKKEKKETEREIFIFLIRKFILFVSIIECYLEKKLIELNIVTN